MKVLISGVAGFVGSHLADYLIEQGYEVVGVDNFLTGSPENINSKVIFYKADIRDFDGIHAIFNLEKPEWVFHEAANPRTFLSIEDPLLDEGINITGTLNMLIASRDAKVKKFMFASSCIINSPNTPYYVSKLAGEEYCKIFNKLYDLPTICLRYSNVYGSLRQSEKGSWINAIASLHKSKRDTGRIWISGDGEQARDWTHVKDVARANLLAAKSNATGVFDICTGIETSMNKVAKYFNCPVDYIPDLKGDAKHLSKSQNWVPAWNTFDYKFEIPFNEESLKPYL